MEFLHFLPYKVAFYNTDLTLVYSNGKSDGSVFSEQEEKLADWIWEELKGSKTHRLDTQVPLDAFNQVLMQSYQMLFDDKGDCTGVLETVQDISPMLSSYLENSGQALVGWSDVTSGASISNDE